MKTRTLLAAALLLRIAVPAEAASQTPADSIYDSPATQALVERVIRESGTLPPGLTDVRVRVETAMYLTLAADSAVGGDLPVTRDEFVSTVRWNRAGVLHQQVDGHRVRMLAPAPYTLGTVLDGPWVIPHLYGSTISVLSSTVGSGGGRRSIPEAVHPFGARGPEFYRYRASDTIRIATRSGSVTLVPISVQPRAATGSRTLRLVVGSFWVDTERAAVARARFGFTEPGRGLVGQTGTFLELENGLWEGRYWLPVRQRRELQVASPLLGGAVAGRIVNVFQNYQLNTDWLPERPERSLLLRAPGRASDSLFAGWSEAVGDEAARVRASDFDDLRLAIIGAADPATSALRLSPYYARGEHLFRYNRVEGAYLGAGARLLPADPLQRRWELYGSAGWAFAEGTPRGELVGRWRAQAPGGARDVPRTELSAGLFRRLNDTRAFRPSFEWSWFYAFSALLAGTDERDYYDARGAELIGRRQSGPFLAQLGVRLEAQDTVRLHTTRYLLGTARRFSPLAEFEPGTHAAVEAELAFARGSGAFGLGNGLVTALHAEQGLADFRFTRLVGLLSFRRAAGPLVLAARLDGGHLLGGAPPQKLFRFGSTEGLSGYEPDEFGGSTAALAHGRLLVPLPPRTAEPMARSGPFFMPPPRPALVLLGEAGWARVSERLRPELQRVGALPTDGVRGSVGAGLSVFDDAISLEYAVPLRVPEGAARPGRWYLGLTRWF